MMGWFVTFLLWIGLTVLGELLRPKTRFDRPEPSGLGDFQFPTAEEGRAIPVVWGTCKIAGPNVLWYGDLEVRPVVKKVPTGWFGLQKEDVVVAYWYNLGVQYGLCAGPIDELIAVLYDDKEPTQTITATGNPITVYVNASDLYGGIDGEGGVVGDMDVYTGAQSQTPNDYLEGVLGTDLPGYPFLCYAVARHMYLGTTPYIKPTAWVVRRTPNPLGLTLGEENIDGDANPACMIYELLTNTVWGLGLSSAAVDLDNFIAVAQTLADESSGLSLMVDSHTPAREVIEAVCRHIDGVVYADPETGLFRITLARNDYVLGDLPIFDASNVLECQFARPGWENTRNVVKVRYTDRADNFQEKVAQAIDQASLEARAGEVAVEEIDFLGVSNAAQAQRVAARSLMALSYPFASLSVKVNRAGWALRPGSVFKLTWAPLGIDEMVCRVNRIDAGTLESGELTVECVEDVFAVAWTAYTAPPASGWTDPMVGLPPVPLARAAIHAPYEAALAGGYADDPRPSALVMLAPGSGGATVGFNLHWQTYLGAYSDTQTVQVATVTPLGYLVDDVTAWADSFTIESGVGLSRLESVGDADWRSGRNLLLIAGADAGGADWEIVAFRDVAPAGADFLLSSLARGCADTIPRAHLAGAAVWIVSYGFGLAPNLRPAFPSGPGGQTAYPMKVNTEPYHFRSGYPTWESAFAWLTHISHTSPSLQDEPNWREEKPYAPAHLEECGVEFATNIAGELVLTWEHRARDLPWDYGDSGVTETLPSEVFYRLRIYDEEDDLIYEANDLQAKTFTLDLGDEISLSGLGRPNATMRVTLRAQQGEIVSPPGWARTSWQEWDHTFDCAGWGMLWNEYWSGTPGRD